MTVLRVKLVLKPHGKSLGHVMFRKVLDGARAVLLLSGGECTVSGWRGGVGGPKTEVALSAAIELGGQLGISLPSCDTDGVDGSNYFAGAVVFPNTLCRAKSLGLDPNDFFGPQ